jgi:serpin B
MTYAGARGNTAEELRTALGFPTFSGGATSGADLSAETPGGYRSHVAHAFGSLASAVSSDASAGGHVLAEANALWCQEGRPFLESFLTLNRDAFGAGVSTLDFANDHESARVTINDWVEEQTLGKIENLIRRGDLDRLVRIVLTNAVYFKGLWAEQFDPSGTREMAFHTRPGDAAGDVVVPMMTRTAEYGYARLEEHRLALAELPYEGGGASMLVMLPDDGDLEELESKLTPANLDAWAQALRKREIVLSIPRFSMTWGTEDLIPELRALGIVDLFSDRCDLSGMDGTTELYVSHVLHKAFVEVNEEGTEAAAATAVVGRLKAAMPVSFVADRPFLFVIRDTGTGAILFAGRVVDPTA